MVRLQKIQRNITRQGNTYVLKKKSLQPVHKPNADISLPNLDTHKRSSPKDLSMSKKDGKKNPRYKAN